MRFWFIEVGKKCQNEPQPFLNSGEFMGGMQGFEPDFNNLVKQQQQAQRSIIVINPK